MNIDFDNSEQFAAQLRELKPSQPGPELQMRLEAALREADPGEVAPTNIIQHPFFQWSAAAAALFVALLLAVDSTGPQSSQVAETEAERSASSEVRPVYRVVDGKLIPANGRAAMMRTSYRGIEVIEGRTYRKYGEGDESFVEPVLTSADRD